MTMPEWLQAPTVDHRESWYCWKELVQLDGDEHPRLLTPWRDPYKYEWAFDWLFTTVEEAIKAKEENAPDETWILVHETLSAMRRIGPEEEE